MAVKKFQGPNTDDKEVNQQQPGAVAPGASPAAPEQTVAAAAVNLAIDAAKDEAAQNAAEIVMLPLSVLVPYNKVNYHIDETELSWLVDDVRVNGVIIPIQVKPLSDGQYMVLSGHRRLMASRMVGASEIPAIIKDVDEETAEIIFHATNILNRTQLAVLEKAKGYKALYNRILRDGISMREQFNDGNVSYRMVKRYITILDLVEPLQAMVNEGQIGVSAGSEIARLPAEKQRILYQYIQSKGDKFRINERQASAIVSSAKPDFREVITDVLEPERKRKVNFQKHINKTMKEHDIYISDDELLDIIIRAILAYKEQGAENA